MSEELQEMQRQIVSAVQQELTRFSGEVAGNLQQLGGEVAAGATARAELEIQVKSLAEALEAANAANASIRGELQQALDDKLKAYDSESVRRHDEMTTRLGRVVDEANVGIVAAVESAAHPILKKVELRQEKTESEVRNLDGSIRRFDDQAGQMVNHINQVTAAVEGRLASVTSEVTASFDERFATVISRVDDVSAMAARQQAEVSNIVAKRVDASEERVNDRMLGLEDRLGEEIGQRVADIDAHVGRIGAGLDDAVITLSDRIAKADNRFADVEAEFVRIREELENVDAEAIDEIKEQISSALGQAELVRIEMDRFQVTINESLDKTAVRLTEIETTVNDQSMDVEMAVQLERLEEVERAVLMLDPDILGHDDDGFEDSRFEESAFERSAHAQDLATEPAANGPVANGSGLPEISLSLGSLGSDPLTPPTAEPNVAAPTTDDSTVAMSRPSVDH